MGPLRARSAPFVAGAVIVFLFMSLALVLPADAATPARTLSIADVSIVEGNSGTSLATFTVKATAGTTTATVDYATANKTAVAPADYTGKSGTFTFAANETTKTFTVPIVGDAKCEPSETFLVNLSKVSGATLTRASAIGTIVDDEKCPYISAADVSVAEGNSGTKNATFTVKLSAPYTKSVAVTYATANGTAVAPGDYTGANATLNFSAGQTQKSVAIKVNGDTAVEPTEQFTFNLSSPVNGMISDKYAVGTIRDDDSPPPPAPTLTIGDVGVAEGTGLTRSVSVPVWLTAAATQPIQFTCSATNGSATAGADYTAPSPCTGTIAAGSTSSAVNVSIVGDNVIEPNETFTINVLSATGASIGDGQGLVTLIDDDTPTVWVGDVFVNESDSGTNVVANVPVTMSQTVTVPVTVTCTLVNGSAVAPNDYTVPSPCGVTIAPGQSAAIIAVPIVGDGIDELDESFQLQITGVTNGVAGGATSMITIYDNDPPPIVTVADTSTVEGTGFAHTISVTAYLSRPSSRVVTVGCTGADGSAWAQDDYVVEVGTGCFVFQPGQQQARNTPGNNDIAVFGDSWPEFDEDFYVNLTSVTNAVISDSQARVVIVNDDCIWPFC